MHSMLGPWRIGLALPCPALPGELAGWGVCLPACSAVAEERGHANYVTPLEHMSTSVKALSPRDAVFLRQLGVYKSSPYLGG